jgi:hypothetical protein
MRVPSKRGKVPPAIGLYTQSRSKVDLYVDKDGIFGICAAPGENEKRFVESFSENTHGTLYVPIVTLPPQNYETARFICKVALEVLAYQGMHLNAWNREVVDKTELDELRAYVRRGRPEFIWPVHIRRIYAPDFLFADGTFPPHNVLHEWDILAISDNTTPQVMEYYAVIAIFGVEYAINLGGPELDGYHRWLKNNDHISFLYSKKGDANISMNK